MITRVKTVDIANFLKKYGILLILIALMLLFTALSDVFLTSRNLLNISRQISMIGIASVGGMFVMLLGGIDLSKGALVSFVNIVCSYFIVNTGMDFVMAIFICLVISAMVGYINGILVTAVNIPPLIATLGSQTILYGFAYIISRGQSIAGFPDAFRVIGQGHIWEIPVPVIVLVLFLALGYFILNKTYLGRSFYAIGGNAEAAKLSGINVNRVKRLVYMMSGLFTGFAAIVMLSRVNSGHPNTGLGFEFDVITAIVLGGISVSGGSGRLFNAVVGVFIIGVVNNGLVLIGMTHYVQMVVKGVILITAVGIDCMQKRVKV